MLDLRVELLLGVLREPGRGPLERAVERGEMPSLGFLEAGRDPGPRLGLVALELLTQRPLAGTNPLADLVEGAAPFGSVDLRCSSSRSFVRARR